MKTLKLMCLIIALLGLVPTSSVWARGGHHHGYRGYGGFGLGLGLGYGLGYGGYGRYGLGYGGYGWGYPGYGFGYGGYYPPYYAYPPMETVPAAPPVYIEQQQGIGQATTAEESQGNYWYYCRKPEGYYPHVKKCPEGWMQVVPQSPAQ